MIKFELTLSSRDLAVLQMALFDQRSTKDSIRRFYCENPSEPLLTPLEPLTADIDALDRLIHIFAHTGERCRNESD